MTVTVAKGSHAARHGAAGADAATLTETQITSLTTDLAAKAPLASPALTGAPTAPTAATGDSSTKLATTALVAAKIAALGLGTASTHAATDFVASPATPATNGQLYGYDATLAGTRAFNPAAASYQSFNISGSETAFSGAAGNPATLVIPATCIVPVLVGAFCTVTATSAITNLQISLVETSNGTDTVQVAKAIVPSLASGSSQTLRLPECIYLAVTGRARTFTLSVFTASGGGNVLNTPTIAGAANGYPTGIVALGVS